MSSNPQWKSSFQPPDHMNQDSAIIDFKPMTSNNKPSQTFNFSTSRSSNSRFGQDFPILQDGKSSTFTNDLYGNNTTNTGTTTNNSRFPPIGTFTLDTNNMFNNSNNSAGDNTLSNNVFSNGNTSNSNNYHQDSANSANLGTRETGIIEKLLHSYGFIQCCERQARLFFHFSQFSGNIEHLKIGDPVEFEMTYDRRTGKPIASAVTKIAPEVVLSEERVTGTVTTEVRSSGSNNENGSMSNGGSSGSGNSANGSSSGDTTGRISYENRGECFFLPYTKDDVEGNVTLRSGDKVSFQIATNNRGNLGACHVRLENPAHPVKYQGVVCSMKESFGFIERADVVKEIFFHFSEAKTKEELRLGDDVEFTIQTRNGKEVACNIIRLPPGTVIFEDLKPEIIKGQVLKPLDRGPNLRQQQQQQQQQIIDALPGRIRYRSQLDHSEVEISFGDKDQNGDFTLRHGDWVQFKIATDRRDGLNRATNIQLLDESFLVSGEKRECGIVIAIKDGYGFLKCVERDARVFFHFNEILNVEHELKLGDEFEFTLIQEQQLINQSFQQQNQRQCAIRMKLLPMGTVQFEQRLENNLIGCIVKDIPQQSPLNNWLNRSPVKTINDLNDCYSDSVSGLISYTNTNGLKRTISYYLKDCDLKFPSPKLGDKVQFNINQIKRNKELIAVNVQVQQNGLKQIKTGQVYQGFIAALKDGFGFIETNEHNKEVFFHFSNFDGEPNLLELGQEVEYNVNIQTNNLNKNNNGNLSGTCSSAENVKLIPKGTIVQAATIGSDILNGIVKRPLRSVNPDQNEYSGLIRVIKNQDDSEEQLKMDENQLNDEEEDEEFEFGIMGLMNKRELLQIGDFVQFQIDASGRAVNIQAQRKKLRATVDAIKGHFGFLTYELDDGKKLFFHMTEVKDNCNLQIGDTVEFVLVTNHRSGKSSACSVVKVSDVQARPERLISRLRTVSMDDAGPKLIVIRQPKGPDGSRGFTTTSESRVLPRLPGIQNE